MGNDPERGRSIFYNDALGGFEDVLHRGARLGGIERLEDRGDGFFEVLLAALRVVCAGSILDECAEGGLVGVSLGDVAVV